MNGTLLHWLTRHETIVALAVVAAAFSLLSTLARTPRIAAPRLASWCNGAAYALMAGSMLLFIVAGLR